MATAQELFALTTGEEQHIVIGSDRYITVPEPLKRIAVQFDHDVETVTFDCPRYWDDLDMSKMVIYINYKLPDGTLDAYPAKNIKVDGDIMHFDWTISRNLTQYKGTITFLVCIKKTDTDGVEVNHWNSELCTDMYVSEGMECQEQAQMEYSDLITQLLERMSVVEDINVQAEEMQALHDETLEAAALAKDESNYIKNSYANAYKQSVSGEVIRVDDVSPLEHILDVSVHGKNLIPYPYDSTALTSDSQVTVAGLTYTDNKDGSIHVIGTVDANTFSNIMIKRSLPLKDGTTYYIGNSSNLLLAYKDAFGVIRYLKNQVFTWSKDYEFIQLYVQYSPGVVVDETLYPMLCVANAPTDYVPYIDPSTITLKRCGKAVFSMSEYELVKESGAWTSILIAKIKIGPGNYVAHCKYKQIGTDISKVCMSARAYTDLTIQRGNVYSTEKNGVLTVPFTIETEHEGFQIFLYSNHDSAELTTDCIFSDIMVEVGLEATNYEKYTGETYTPKSDGTVDAVYSLSPTMTLFTDTDGITIDLTYNRDNNKVIGDISTALDILIAMQENTIDLLDSMSGGAS